MKNKWLFIICVISISFLFCLLSFQIFRKKVISFSNHIIIDGKYHTTEIIEFRNLSLLPGKKTEYKLYLTCKDEGNYSFNIDFFKNEDSYLNEILNVYIMFEDEIVFKENLSNILDDEKMISFNIKLSKTEKSQFTIIYEMPISVGNEAQGLKTALDIKLIVDKVGE